MTQRALTIPETILLGMRQEDLRLVPMPQSLLASAVAHLRKCGHQVEPAAGIVPGLWLFDGAEITTGQLLHAADQIA